MKSPLSFITGLIRRRPVEQQPLLIGHDSPAKDSVSEAQQAPIAVDPPLPPIETSHEESVVDEAAPAAAAIVPEVAPLADVSLPVDDEPRKPASDPVTVKATPRARRRPRATVAAETLPAAGIAPEKVSVEEPSAAVPAASDDAIALDTEISELRKQLTRKLELQNAQLKKMLERFGS